MARSSSHRNGTLNAVSPHSMAYLASRSRWARQTCHRTPWPRWLPSMSETHTCGWRAPNSAVTTALPRRGLITCNTARVVTNTHSHQFLPFTRTDVSSEQTTELVSTTCSIVVVAFSRGCRATARVVTLEHTLAVSER